MGSRLAAVLLALVLVAPGVAAAQSPAAPKLDWETGEGKSFLIPALEIPAFVFALNRFNHATFGGRDYDVDDGSIGRNLRTAPVFDADPFSVNQIGHPYQGGIYYGFARSAGLNYWQSLLYTVAGSFLWETAGETTKPSINDHVSTGIGGSFVGEATFRMANLLLEGGGSRPGFWRELGAGLISPSTGFNRLVFGDRFDAVYPSRNPAIFIRLRLGATLTTDVTNEGIRRTEREQDGSADFYMTYGLPGKPGYQYKRPFDYFVFEFTGVPNADTPQDAIENVTVRGLLVGSKYDWGDDYRGLWGLFGGYEYFSPQVFRLATTNVGLGTVGQWWLTRTWALQGTALVGLGFGASGTVADEAERDYRYGVIPQGVLSLRLIAGDLAMLEAAGRQYHVIGTGEQVGRTTDRFGSELIHRASIGLTVRVYGPHALSIQYVVSSRDADTPGRIGRHQAVETMTLSYNFLGHRRFGAVEWRPGEH